MMNFKKVARLSVVACLVTGILLGAAGCGKKEGNVGNSTSNTSAGTSQTAKLDPVELTWYYSIAQIQPDNEKVFAEFNKYLKDKINATIKFQPVLNADYDQKMKLMVASSDVYDMCFTASWRNNYVQNVAKDAFLPVDSLLSQYAPKTYSQIPKALWDAVKVQGKIYSVINYQITCRQKGVWLMKDMVDKYKFDVKNVKELKDMEPFLKAVKENENGVYPFEVRTDTKGVVNNLFETLGYEVVNGPAAIKLSDKDAKVVDVYQEPFLMPYLKMIREWYNKGYIRNDVLTVKDTETDKKAKKYASGIASNIKPGAEADNKSSYGWDAVFVPLSQPISTTSTCTAALTAISKTSKNPQRAMMALEIVNSDPTAYNILANGIEGVHYTKDAANPKRVNSIATDKYKPGFEWIFGNQFNAYLVPGKIDTVWEDTKKMNESAVASPILGMVMDVTPISTEVASFSQLRDELWLPLDCGTVDPEAGLQKFLDKEAKINSQKIIDEVKKTVENFKKTR